MIFPRDGVKVQNTHNLEKLGSVLVELIGFLNSPKRDQLLLEEAGVSIDRALFPLLVALGEQGTLGVAELADLVGRDYTTISRQLAKLESLALVKRYEDEVDRRKRAAQVTNDGRKIVKAITVARQQLLSQVLAGWSESDRRVLAEINRRFAVALNEYAQKVRQRE